MIRNIRNRFPAERWMRIAGWTTLSVAWATAVLARVVVAPPEPTVVPDPQPVVAVGAVSDAMPLLPGQGLVVLRSMPSSTPEPEVVVLPAPAGSASPTASTSTGS